LILMTALRGHGQHHSGPRVKRAAIWSVSADGIRIVFGDPALRALLLFGWLTGFFWAGHELDEAARQGYRRPALLSGLGATTGVC
jgi:hypothetical protein